MRKRKQAVYVGSNTDTFFSGLPGYTHIGRTRKGGDKRPRGLPTPAPKPIPTGNGSTLLNYFSLGGRPVTPLQSVKETTAKPVKKKAKPGRPPITRTLGGKPPPNEEAVQADRIAKLKYKLQRSETFGSLAKAPQDRRSWNDSVSILIH